MAIFLHLTSRAYEAVRAHLLQDNSEQAAFLFIKTDLGESGCALEVIDYYLVPAGELVGGGDPHYLELTDEAKAKVIKMASDKKTALGEIHSHPFSLSRSSFSPSDLEGFREFVPHVWWRLRGKPYIALVMGQRSFDALVWLDDPRSPIPLDALLLDGNKRLKPTGLTLAGLKRKWKPARD
jgi:hypothetical protein